MLYSALLWFRLFIAFPVCQCHDHKAEILLCVASKFIVGTDGSNQALVADTVGAEDNTGDQDRLP